MNLVQSPITFPKDTITFPTLYFNSKQIIIVTENFQLNSYTMYLKLHF